ncbi:MAG: S24 family peptidase [Desulfococcaceae bacterium]|jgi:phage repressor protein C with HTH and peptisase S24 domain|nr:S24 family peptidase [Desulfococcaceae bacterium]
MSTSAFDIFLTRVFEATGIRSQNELALFLKVNRSAITQAKKKDAVPENWIFKLSRSFGLNPDWLEKGRGQQQAAGAGFLNVPKVKARLSAGGGSFQVDQEIEHYYSFHRKWLRKKGEPDRMMLMDITGNSMEPELRDGDTVLVDGSQTEILAGAVYALGIEDVIMIKRVEKHPKKLVLLSDNRHYAPIYLQGDEIAGIRVIGKVIWVCREYR